MKSWSTRLVFGAPLPGDRVGSYRIEQQLGCGGMGSVFLATRADEEYNQQVAIKIAHASFDSTRVLNRFRAERQILAGLEHPHIARLLDGGALPDSRPYLVMEYVPGTAIGEYCRRQNLPITERLKLFLQVCEAVAYAHAKLIIHRDIKPANVLVTGCGDVKLLDFGIAKLISPETSARPTALTHTWERILTPDYSSPEQIRGESLTVGTDIYLLGLLLYELLSGCRPFEQNRKDVLSLQLAICRQDPARPSSCLRNSSLDVTRNHVISPDLDKITLKALRKEPLRRYSSVEAFAQDIGQYLTGYPVRAAGDA